MKYLVVFENFDPISQSDSDSESTLSHSKQNVEHYKNMKKTGFWGKQGAGCLVVCRHTKRFLLPHRSEHVLNPNTWGVWGGAIDDNEDPKQAAKRELAEEAVYSGEIELIPLSVFQKDKFRYYNFLAIVDEEFEPELNWETKDFIWTTLDEFPQPLHFGLEWVLNKDRKKIESIVSNL